MYVIMSWFMVYFVVRLMCNCTAKQLCRHNAQWIILIAAFRHNWDYNYKSLNGNTTQKYVNES